MKKIIYRQFGGPDVLELVDSPTPTPGPGQILVAVHAAAVNAFDWRVREGQKLGAHPVTLPAGVGLDAAGTVEAVGEGVTDVIVGDAVFGEGEDTYAESSVFSVWRPKPTSLTFAEAAGYPSIVETAFRVLRDVNVNAGDTLLVSGASGGVGSALIQIATASGVRVIGTASPANQDYVQSLGALSLSYDDGWATQAAGYAPIDAAIDLAGAGVLPQLVELTGSADKVVTIADLTAADYGVRFSGSANDVGPALDAALELVADGKLSIPATALYRLDEAAKAHSDSQSGHTRGRRILEVRPHNPGNFK